MTLPGVVMLMSFVYIPRVPSILLAVVLAPASLLLFLLLVVSVLLVLFALLAVLALLTVAPVLLPALQQRPSHLFLHLDAVGPILYMGKVFTLPAVP